MTRVKNRYTLAGASFSLLAAVMAAGPATAQTGGRATASKPKLPDQTYMPVTFDKTFDEVIKADVQAKD